MASDKNTIISLSSAYGLDSNMNNTTTTFVQADPSNFQAIVQKLTGQPQSSSSTHKLSSARIPKDIGPRKSAFKLHERRQRKLEIKLNNNGWNNGGQLPCFVASPLGHKRGGGHGMVSPVSTLDFFELGSPRTPCEEEERAIANKEFYLHPTTPRGDGPPKLLTLFPLHSPRDSSNNDVRTEC